MNDAIRIWMQGAISMAYVVIAFYFVRFYRQTHRALFVFFAAGFAVLAIHRTMYAVGFSGAPTFLLRLAGYLIILTGVLMGGARSRAA